MKRSLLVLAVAGGPISLASAQSLSTDVSNNGSGGVYMNLTPATTAPLQVNSFDTYFTGTAGNPVVVEVWTRPGVYEGMESNSAAWTLQETVNTTNAGTTVLAPIALTNPIVLQGSTPTAVYLQSVTTGRGIRYTGTSSTPPQTTWSNTDLTLFSDTARTSASSFTGTVNTPRTFAGTVNYAPGNPALTGACCFTDGTCQVVTIVNCSTLGGTFRGDGVTCEAAACPQPGACCFGDGTCSFILESACIVQGGVFNGAGTTCGGVTCPLFLATIPPNSGLSGDGAGIFFDLAVAPGNSLAIETLEYYQWDAAGGPITLDIYYKSGTYVGFHNDPSAWTHHSTINMTAVGGTTTTPEVVTLPTPILAPAGQVTAMYLVGTVGGMRYSTVDASYSNGHATLTGGIGLGTLFTGAGSSPRLFSGKLVYELADLNTVMGACCFGDGTCQVITAANCLSQGGTFAGIDTTCATADCPQPGACCFANGTCSVVMESACTSQNGIYQGDGTVCGTCPDVGSPVFAVDLRAATSRLISFPANFPAENVLGTTPFEGFAMDFNAAADTLYGINYMGDPPTGPIELGTIDQATGAFTPVAAISGDGAGEVLWGGLSLDPTSGTMYAMANNNLYTIDLATAATTFVAAMVPPAGAPLYIDIAFDTQGNLFAHDIGSDELHSVDKATGVATVLGPTGYAANFAQGMDFDFASNTLYATVYTGTGTGSYVIFDTTTGAGTTIAATDGWNAEMEMAVKSPVPTAGGCYANCDGSTTDPVLNVADFSCFLQEFAQGSSYANCDGSTTEPVLNVADFSCFLQEFAGGCQ